MPTPDKPAHAHPHNLRAVASTDHNPQLYAATGRPLPPAVEDFAWRHLADFRGALISTNTVPIHEIAGIEATTRQQLILEATALIRNNLQNPPEKLSTHHAALAGVGVTMAYLDVIAHTAKSTGEPFEFVPRLAKKSAKTILELATHNEIADMQLTILLSGARKKEIESKSAEELFSDLHFRPDYFKSQDGVVSIDYPKLRKLRDPYGRKVDFCPNNRDVILGCPFFTKINDLYTAMTEAALKNDLLKQVYNSAESPNS